MKNIIVILCLFVAFNSTAQTTELDFFDKIPVVKNTTLVKSNGANTFNTKKWVAVTNQNILQNVFGIVNYKNTDDKTVANIKIAGWWGLTEGKVAYLYSYDIKENNKTNTKVLISSYIINQKSNDINVFEILPNPTGMKGKITVIQKCTINEMGAITATQTHKSSNGKVLTKTQSFFINEEGKLEESN
jgi:hypothetical protein